MGNYRLIFPNSDQSKQEKYIEYLKSASWTVPFQAPKSNKNNEALEVVKASSFKDNLRKNLVSKGVNDNRTNCHPKNKSPYIGQVRKFITPSSQKQKKRENVSNPNSL